MPPSPGPEGRRTSPAPCAQNPAPRIAGEFPGAGTPRTRDPAGQNLGCDNVTGPSGSLVRGCDNCDKVPMTQRVMKTHGVRV